MIHFGSGGGLKSCSFTFEFSADRSPPVRINRPQPSATGTRVSCQGSVRRKFKRVVIEFGNLKFVGRIKHPNIVIRMFGGDKYDEMFRNVNRGTRSMAPPGCSGARIERDNTRGFQSISANNLWEQGVIEYSFVSDTSDPILNSKAVYNDTRIGLSRRDLRVMIKAMQAIMEVTCIRFQEVTPEPNKKWLLLMKEGNARECHREYIKANLSSVEVTINNNSLGRIFEGNWDGECFDGAYATLGAWEPSVMISSQMNIKDNVWDVSLFIHEFLHTLGIDHTQKRPGKSNLDIITVTILHITSFTDRDEHINVLYNNIRPNADALSQYDKCTESYCKTHGTAYDCSSIMHYRSVVYGNKHYINNN